MKYTGKKGWQASVKDTWSLDATLSPIIAAGLRKFLEQGADKLGIPDAFYKECDLDEGSRQWIASIEKMLYAFEQEEPDINNYDFDFQFVDDEGNKSKFPEACVPYTMQTTNPEEKARYDKHMEVHEQLRQEGLDLFAKYFKNLWW